MGSGMAFPKASRGLPTRLIWTPWWMSCPIIVTQDGITVDPAKVKDIVEWPVPRSVKEIRGFLGIQDGTGFLSRIIPRLPLL